MVKSKVDEYGLTVRERRFADEYIANGRNATQAYKTISPNAKETTCASKGSEWVRKDKISTYIKTKTKERLSASSLTADNIIDELIEIGFGKIQKNVSKQIDNDTGEILKDVTYEGSAPYKERVMALELLGKNLSMWVDKQEISASIHAEGKLDSILTQLSDDGDG